MVIVGGTMVVEPSQRDAFLAGRLDAMRASRAEPGCLEYTFSADPVDPSRVVLFEVWESQEALDAHLAAMHAPSGSGGSGGSGDSADAADTASSPAPAVTPKERSIFIYDITGRRPLG
jgi:quinol monooxygenase YgiN